MAGDRSRIPLFESEFLQTMAIELQRRLDAGTFPGEARKLEFRVSDHENESGEWECFDVVCTMRRWEYIQVAICADGAANYAYRYPFLRGQNETKYDAFIIDVGDWSPHDVAGLVHDSLRGSPGVLEIWRRLDKREKS